MPLAEAYFSRSRSRPLDITYDRATDIVMIDGVRYAGDLFRAFGFGPSDRATLVTRKEDGVVTVFSFDLTDEGVAAARAEMERLNTLVIDRADAIAPKEARA